MPRTLTINERAVLAHVVVDPDAWWEHAYSTFTVNEEVALAEKVARWKPMYEAAVLSQGVEYKNREQRDALNAL